MNELLKKIKKSKEKIHFNNERKKYLESSSYELYLSMICFFSEVCKNIIKEQEYGAAKIVFIYVDGYTFGFKWRYIHARERVLITLGEEDGLMRVSIFLCYIKFSNKWIISKINIKKYKYLFRDATPERMVKILSELI